MSKGKKMEKETDEKHDEKMKNKEYEKELGKLHVELVKLQEWVKFKGLICHFRGARRRRQGWSDQGDHRAGESAGISRGGATRALRSGSKHRCIPALYPHLPAAGEVVIFDRSWYNRAGVERVMGFCTEEQAKLFLQAVPALRELAVRNPESPFSSTGWR